MTARINRSYVAASTWGAAGSKRAFTKNCRAARAIGPQRSENGGRGRRSYHARWGGFFDNCPQKKFWLGFIPLYGWPGYLQVLSAVDAYHGRRSDNLKPID